jgi:hypothetical protein
MLGFPIVVVVTVGNELASRAVQTFLTRRTDTMMFSPYYTDRIGRLSRNFSGLVTSIIDDDNFEVMKVLKQYRIQSPTKTDRPIVGTQNHANDRSSHTIICSSKRVNTRL